MRATRGAERVRELPAHLPDFPQRDEGGQGQQRQQRQHRSIEPARGHHPCAGRDDREATEAGHRLVQRVLAREVGEERHPRREIGAGARRQLLAPRALALERDDLRHPLDRVHRVGTEIPRDFPCARAELVDVSPAQQGAQRGIEKEGQERDGQRPAEHRQRAQHGQRHDDGDQHRRDRVGEEVLDQLDVVGGHGDEIAAPASRQVRGSERVELPEEREPHVVEQPVGHVVGEPRLEPVEQPGQRRRHRESDQQRAERRVVLHGAHDQRAQHADRDDRGHSRDAKSERGDEPLAIAADHPDEDRQRLQPAHRLRADGAVFGDRCSRALTLRGARRRARAVDGDQVFRARRRHLRVHEPPVRTASRHQLSVRPRLGEPAAVEHHDPVGADHAREAMGEDQRGAAFHQPIERLLDERLALGVHRGERLVEHEDRRIAQERARDRDTLALAAREADPPLADDGGVALGQPRDELVGVGGARGGLELGRRRVGLAHPQVLLDGAVEEVGVLAHHGDAPAQVVERQLADVVPADEHAAGIGIVEAEEQADDGGLAAAARADEGDPLARAHVEVDAVVRDATPARIRERHALEGDGRRG